MNVFFTAWYGQQRTGISIAKLSKKLFFNDSLVHTGKKDGNTPHAKSLA